MLQQFRRSFLSSSIFVNRAHAAVSKITNKEFWLRKGEVKELVEEVLPMAALLKHLDIPGRKLSCRLAKQDSVFDAELKFAGPDVDHGRLDAHQFVEITTATSATHYLYRESLATLGYAFGGTKISRVGSRKRGDAAVESEACAVDPVQVVVDSIQWIRKRIENKNSKPYRSPCILLINLEIDRPFFISEWKQVIEQTSQYPDRSKFKRVYLVRWADSSVFSI